MQTNLTGLSIANISNPIETYQQLGGPGRVFNKALAIPFHLGFPWHSVEFVLLPPGHNGVGMHQQQTDEIYVILSGQGELVTNGESALVETGIMACAPMGTTHSLTNTSETEALALLVVELATPEGNARTKTAFPSVHHLLRDLHESTDGYPIVYRQQCVPSLRTTVDLCSIFSAPWGTLSLLVLPPGGRVDPYIEQDNDQLFFLMRGHATWSILTSVQTSWQDEVVLGHPTPDHPDDLIHLNSENPDDQWVQSVLVPCGVACGFTNRASGDYPLMMVLLTVRRTQAQTASPGSQPGKEGLQ